jgi:hypothetical protein
METILDITEKYTKSVYLCVEYLYTSAYERQLCISGGGKYTPKVYLKERMYILMGHEGFGMFVYIRHTFPRVT